jgi:hypothetical protein
VEHLRVGRDSRTSLPDLSLTVGRGAHTRTTRPSGSGRRHCFGRSLAVQKVACVGTAFGEPAPPDSLRPAGRVMMQAPPSTQTSRWATNPPLVRAHRLRRRARGRRRRRGRPRSACGPTRWWRSLWRAEAMAPTCQRKSQCRHCFVSDAYGSGGYARSGWWVEQLDSPPRVGFKEARLGPTARKPRAP